MNTSTWPFADSPATAVLTTVYVTQSGMPILYVSHDDDEEGGGLWQFHCGNDDYDGGVLQLVRLDEICRIDEDVAQIADLPIGSSARRVAPGSPWVVQCESESPSTPGGDAVDEGATEVTVLKPASGSVTGVKIHIRLEQDEDGYPPAAVESLWAEPGANEGEYVLDNVPFFVRVATIGDTVSTTEEDGQLWLAAVVQRSANSLLRVVFFDPLLVPAVNGDLVALGCITEYLSAHKLLAVSVPRTASLQAVQGYLRTRAELGGLDYEEPLLRHAPTEDGEETGTCS